MRVWLLTVGEPLPTDSGAGRLWRTGLLAESLLARGHEVVWWSSAFDHFQRRLRTPVDIPISIRPGFCVWQLSGTPYARNISIARVRNHRQVARRFLELSVSAPAPDIIVSSLPTLELSEAAVAYGRPRSIPVALDVRDLWPDVVFEMLPQPFRIAAELARPWVTRPLTRAATGATAIVGVTDEFVEWGVAAARRPRTDRDRAFPMGYSGKQPTEDDQRRAAAWWRGQGLNDDDFVLCFFGTLGWMFDLAPVLGAAELIATRDPSIKFVLCGGGENLDALRRRAAALPNVILPGHVGFAEIWTLMRLAAGGLAPYRDLRNFSDNLPNKPIEYLSAGLPILAPNMGILSRLLASEGCGLTYSIGSSASLTDAVVTLRRNDAARSAMSVRASELFQSRYVAEDVYRDMSVYLEQLSSSQ